jgi:hypothetical protein
VTRGLRPQDQALPLPGGSRFFLPACGWPHMATGRSLVTVGRGWAGVPQELSVCRKLCFPDLSL